MQLVDFLDPLQPHVTVVRIGQDFQIDRVSDQPLQNLVSAVRVEFFPLATLIGLDKLIKREPNWVGKPVEFIVLVPGLHSLTCSVDTFLPLPGVEVLGRIHPYVFVQIKILPEAFSQPECQIVLIEVNSKLTFCKLFLFFRFGRRLRRLSPLGNYNRIGCRLGCFFYHRYRILCVVATVACLATSRKGPEADHTEYQ